MLQGYLVQLVVALAWRRRGTARALVDDVTRRSGVRRVDRLTEHAHGFHASPPHRTVDGRVYPLR